MRFRVITFLITLVLGINLGYSQKATGRLYAFYNSSELDDLSDQDAFDTYRDFIKVVFEDDEINKCKAKDCLFLDVMYLWIDFASYLDTEQSSALAEDIRFFKSKGLDLNKKQKGYRRYLFAETFELLIETLYESEEAMYISSHLSTIIKGLIEVGVDFHAPMRKGKYWEGLIESIISDNVKNPFYEDSDLLIQIMMENGVDMNKAHELNSESPFFYTILLKNRKILNVMLKNGVNINQTSKGVDAMSMIMNYSDVTDFEMIKMLLLTGFDPNYSNLSDGTTPLMNLAYASDTTQTVIDSVLSLLENKGTDYNAQDKNGDTVLHHALRKLDYTLIALNQNRTNIDLKNKNGYTALAEAEIILQRPEYKDDPRLIAIVKLLRKASFD